MAQPLLNLSLFYSLLELLDHIKISVYNVKNNDWPNDDWYNLLYSKSYLFKNKRICGFISEFGLIW